MYMDQGYHLEAEKLEVMIDILKRRGDDVVGIARSFDEEVMKK